MSRPKPPRSRALIVLTAALCFSVLLNIVFIAANYRRNIVVSVPDGDSLDLADGRRIRLLGIDAPERGRCMAAEARNYLVQHAHGRHVRLKNTVIDSYGRVLANVILNDIRSWSSYMSWRIKGLFIRINALVTRRKGPIDAQPSSLGITFNEKKPGMRASIGGTGAAGPQGDDDPLLNRALVRYGLARFEHVKSEYAGSLRLAEETAKDRNLGIYSSACRSAIPPGACGIKGNIRQGIKRYYTSGCRQYNQVIVDLSYGDRWFCSGREAEDAGFTLSPSCK